MKFLETSRNGMIRYVHPADIYLFKVNDKNTGKMCEICSKLTIKTPEDVIANYYCYYYNLGLMIRGVAFRNFGNSTNAKKAILKNRESTNPKLLEKNYAVPS